MGEKRNQIKKDSMESLGELKLRIEALNRELEIEAALEKVRSRTMAMHKSEEIPEVAALLFQQFIALGENPERIFIATLDEKDPNTVDLWGTNQGGNLLNKFFRLPADEPTVISKAVSAWKAKKKSLVIDLQGEELKTYLEFLYQAGMPVIEGRMFDRRVQTIGCFSKGVIGITTSEPRPVESVQLLERFATVFDLAYTRFLDLERAEAQARTASIETALEKVRARALAMQQPEELKEVVQVLRTEMGLLGVNEIETCSMYMRHDNSGIAECWYALKDPETDEKKLVADEFIFDLNKTWITRELLKFLDSEKNQASIPLAGVNRQEWVNYCYNNSPVLAAFYDKNIPDRIYHFVKFSQSAIAAASTGEISDESWHMLHRAAGVFSLAYSRFKDLSKAREDLEQLKAEKIRAEDALQELKTTQKQLIQSEKMASLGELTAGIAHEIQNPLNFVNNFSEVNTELIDELDEQLAMGNMQQAKELSKHLRENEEKINHHGKRADAIVKSMLQHSRTSSGKKELVDINALADEYLRLSYHGLRAKDSSFQARFETSFDPGAGKINVVPQEIGRVLLNLLNNAFYAVTERKKQSTGAYDPLVKISTKKLDGQIEVSIADNGIGIPTEIADKIFQPFFTTKPTGQGTGLGLSLSYDIIKAHGGDIRVDTGGNEGTRFSIVLPT